jgi:hypothetical protein
MNKQEILRHIAGFCPDITIDDERYVYTEANFLCGLEIMDDAIVLFYPHYNKEKCEVYTGIRGYDDIVDIWGEYRYRLKRTNDKLVKSSV